MTGSLQIAKLFGIPLKIHWTFALILVWIFYWGYSAIGGFNWLKIAATFLALIALFACVVLHELGHALTARRFGVRTRNILLLPIGGLAVLDRLPEKPFQEFLVAVAGPMVNIGLSILFTPILLMIPWDKVKRMFDLTILRHSNVFTQDLSFLDTFLFGLVALNLAVAFFNLIPAFPMDGGRILRALLSIRMSRIKATRLATRIGQVFAILLILIGIKDQEYLVFSIVGVFLFFMAASEYRNLRNESVLEKYDVGEILRSNFTRLYLGDPLSFAFDHLKRGSERHFLVFDHWHNLKGILQETDIISAMKMEKVLTEPIDKFYSLNTKSLSKTTAWTRY